MTTQATDHLIPLAEGGRIILISDPSGGAFLNVTTAHQASRASVRVWLTPEERQRLLDVLTGEGQ